MTGFATWAVDPHTEWTRTRLQVLLLGTVVVVLLLIGGGAWSVLSLLRPDPADPATTATTAAGTPAQAGTAEDRLANQPLPQAPLENAQPGPLSTGTTGTLRIPTPSAIGPANVSTGFPHTPEGALAQLIAIDQTALSSASVQNAQAVITSWSEPGGPTAHTWSGVRAVATLLSAAGLPADAAGDLAVTVEPAMGFIKGTVGADFVVPCVDLVISTHQAGTTERIAAADCQRMVWDGDRWVIGPGDEPAPAPSLWPGTQASFDAGYRWLEAAP
ncbi:hypothetical protein DDE18_15735 [Nocardioides gansuensis]|uniref:Uncharacterized protein n=1 Tax=Nocardioides gansuensis TaxID=2138300 RepID=A0A2T8F927_9ACTN|nr:hypothetical protein DDE18_15735 [Nocardioides gansuensis]